MTRPKLFISHSHRNRDREWVERFSRSLAQKGLSAWSDVTEIHPGDNLEDAIETALRSSDTVVLILDEDQAQSPWALFDMGAAIGMGKRVIVVFQKISMSSSCRNPCAQGYRSSDRRRRRPRRTW